MKNPFKQLSKINPQRDDGHRQIENKVYMELMAANLTGAEYKVCLAVLHHTWGFNKPSDCISNSQFVADTGLSDRAIRIVIKALKHRRFIYYEPKRRVNRGSPLNCYLFNKHYDTWLKTRRNHSSGVNHSTIKGELEGILRVNHSSPTKETLTKETILKKEEGAKKSAPQRPPIERFNKWIAENQTIIIDAMKEMVGVDGYSQKTHDWVKVSVGGMRLWIRSQDKKADKKDWKRFTLSWLGRDFKKQPPSDYYGPRVPKEIDPANMTYEEEQQYYRDKRRPPTKSELTILAEALKGVVPDGK